MTGASLDSFGGGTGFPCGTFSIASKKLKSQEVLFQIDMLSREMMRKPWKPPSLCTVPMLY